MRNCDSSSSSLIASADLSCRVPFIKKSVVTFRALAIRFKISDANISVLQFDNILNGIKNARVTKSETLNGLIKIMKIVINGNYLRIKLTLESIGDIFFRKKKTLGTATKGRCSPSAQRVLDFKLLKNEFIKRLNFSIRSSDKEYLVADTFLENKIKIAAASHDKFIFITSTDSNEDSYNRILRNQFNSDSSCRYNYSTANSYFVMLITSEKFSLIKNLLYSPNYFYSINAMEALLYLSTINKIMITDLMRQKMDSLKAGEFKISIRKAPDVFVTVNGYKELNTTDEEVVKKYHNSIF